jgi:hypothetical protein
MVAITVTSLVPGTKPLPPNKPKRSLRGAVAALFAGPIISKAATAGPSSPTHATGLAGGGVEDSTGSREADSYGIDGNTGGMAGAPSTTDTRPTGRTRFLGDGVQGGSTPGRPIASGTDHVLAGGGYATGTFDKRTTIDGEGGRALGASGRGTSVADETVTVKSSKLGATPAALGRPTVGAAANPAAGTVALVDGTGGVMQIDLHADDITGGTNGRAGALVSVFKRDTDTDVDLKSAIFFGTVDGGTDIGTMFTPGAGIYAVYTAWRYLRKDGGFSYGPFSARATLTVT